MATRMQQRRGTAAQWISTNAGAGPVLNAGEMGWESDTNKFKIGDGVNNWTSLDYFSDINSTVNPAFGSSITFEGATANDFETTLAITDPTADRTITFPDSTGTVALTSDITVTASSTNTLSNKSISLGSNTVTSTLAQLNTAISDADVATLAGTETLTNKTLTSPILTTPNIGVASGTSLTLTGDLTVQGTTTTIDSTTIAVKTAFVFEGATNDSYETTLTVTDPTADRTLTLPDATDTLVGRATTDTLTNKSISLGSNTVTSTLAQLNTAVSDADVASLAGSETLTNKTIAIGSNTVSGTIAQFNTAVTDADFATLAGTETLTNKTLTSPKINEDVAVTATATELNYVDGVTSAIQTQLDAKAPAASPTFTGTVVLPSTVNGPSASTSVNLLFPTTSGHITLGGSQTAGNLTIGGGTQRTTGVIGIGTGATTTGTKTISIGTGSTGGTTEITVGSSSGATSNITLNGTVTAANNLVVTGDLTVNGTTTTINSTTLAVDDKNIVLGDVATPSDTTADGGGITLKGLTDKTFNWLDATDSWTSSEHLTLNATKELRLADTDSTHYVGFKSPGTVTTNKIWTLPAADGTAGYALTTDGSGTLSWAAAGGGGAAFSELMLIGA